MLTIGVLGGTFDPPHLGHVLAACYALSAFDIDQVCVAPSFAHPFDKTPRAPFAARVALCRAAFEPLGNRVWVTDIEQQLSPPTYTVNTIEALRSQFPDAQFRLIIGSDLLPSLPRWHAYEGLMAAAPPAVIPRGDQTSTPPLIDISSSDVRHRLDSGESLDGWVPVAVAQALTAG